MPGYDDLRGAMVERQIKARGVSDPQVLGAMARVPREHFVPNHLKGQAYLDRPLHIDADLTISQPYIVAYMVEALALKGGETVLEIGAGSGYVAAVMAEISGEVYTIERHGPLAIRAAASLQDAGYTNVHLFHGDGIRGWEDEAPFDAILVSAGAHPAAAGRSRARRCRRTLETASGAGNRADLPPRDRACQPLFRSRTSPPVRRIHLGRQNQRGDATGDRTDPGLARYLTVRNMKRELPA